MNNEYRERVEVLFNKFREESLSKQESREFFEYSRNDAGLQAAIKEHKSLVKVVKKLEVRFPWNWVAYISASVVICLFAFDSVFPNYSIVFTPKENFVNSKAAIEFRKGVIINLKDSSERSSEYIAADGIFQYLKVLSDTSLVVETNSLGKLKELTKRLEELSEQGRLLMELLDSIEKKRFDKAKEIYAKVDSSEGADFQMVMADIELLLFELES